MVKKIFISLMITTSCFTNIHAAEEQQLTEKAVMEINQMMSSVQTNMDSLSQDFSKRVLLLGPTGSGKSTLAASLLGKTLTISRRGIHNVLDCTNSGIVHGSRSGTECPEFFTDEVSHLVLCDCPGFEDTGGYKKEIVNAFAIDKLLEHSSRESIKIKLLLVASISELEGQRGNAILSSVDRLKQMFPSNPDIEQKIGLVITKTRGSISAIDYINPITNPDIHPRLFAIFQNHVFTFPAPSSSTGTYNGFADRGNLISFLQKEDSYLINPTHRIIPNRDAMLRIQAAKSTQISIITQHIGNFFRDIERNCRDLTSTNLTRWLDFLSRIQSGESRVSDVRGFVRLVREIRLPFPAAEFEQCLSELERTHTFNTFLTKLLGTTEITPEIRHKIHFSLESTKQNIEILKQNTQRLESEAEARKRAEKDAKKIEFATDLGTAIGTAIGTAATPLASLGTAYLLSKIPAVRNSELGQSAIHAFAEPAHQQYSTQTPSFRGSFTSGFGNLHLPTTGFSTSFFPSFH